MEKIVEHFGLGLLALIAAVLIIMIIVSCLRSGGVLNNIILNYMDSICGRI